MNNPANKRATSRILLMAPVPAYISGSAFQTEAARRQLHTEWITHTDPSTSWRESIGVVINTTAKKQDLQLAFSLARELHEDRISRAVQLPVVLVNCSRDVPASTRVDFLNYGCQVISCATSQQILDLFDIALLDAKRRSRRGITLIIRPGHIPLLAYAGRQQEILVAGRLRKLLIILSSEPRDFSSAEISAILGCDSHQVKVYIDRLRRLIVTAGRRLGTSIGKHSVIHNSGIRVGYCLRARVDSVLFPDKSERGTSQTRLSRGPRSVSDLDGASMQ